MSILIFISFFNNSFNLFRRAGILINSIVLSKAKLDHTNKPQSYRKIYFEAYKTWKAIKLLASYLHRARGWLHMASDGLAKAAAAYQFGACHLAL